MVEVAVAAGRICGLNFVFFKLFGSCFKSVWWLFLHLNGPYLRVVSTQKYFWWSPNWTFFSEILSSRYCRFDNFWPFQDQKTCFLDFLKVSLDLFGNGLGIIFGFEKPSFNCIFSTKGRYMTSKIQFVGQILALWEPYLDDFQVRKVVFWTFSKVRLELLRSCFGIISASKSSHWSIFLARKVDLWPLKSKFYVKFWPSEGVILNIFS